MTQQFLVVLSVCRARGQRGQTREFRRHLMTCADGRLSRLPVSARSDLIHVSMGISGAVLNDCGLSELITRNVGHHPKADQAFLRLSQRYLSRLSSTTGVFRPPYESASELPLLGQFSLARRFIFTAIVTILSFWLLLPVQSCPFAGPELSICRSRAIHP